MTYLAVHGHFYQPPRDDPASGEIPPEHGAEPFANFNEKITAECYRPNAEAGNYGLLSFDFGPTLLSWMAAAAPDVHRKLVAADKAAARRCGAGGALAQSYHHTILPLATRAEKELEIAWGIADFERRFGRRPRGLWLPETAADRETLAVAAAQGIDFTVLAPWQARTQTLDPTRPYWVELPEGRRLAVFFFVRSLSARVSFDPSATLDADRFAQEHLKPLQPRLEPRSDERLLLIATDGELYGHHQPGRHLFLRRLLKSSARRAGFEVTNLARFLDAHPPEDAIDIVEPSSWSCHHGVARWKELCHCTPHAHWKAPLRHVLNALAGDLDRAYEEAAAELVEDPRGLLLASIDLALGRRSLARLTAASARRPLKRAEVARLGDLLEAQRLRHRMFSSCGWFWDELDRIEPKNCLKAAAAAVFRTTRATGEDPSPWLLDQLSVIKSSRTGLTADQVVREEIAKLARSHRGLSNAGSSGDSGGLG